MEKPFVARSLLEITAIFDDLLASLSALQSLSGLDVHLTDENTLLRQVLAALVKNFGIERSSIILYKEEGHVEAVELDWEKGQFHTWSETDLLSNTLPKAIGTEKALADRALHTGTSQSWASNGHDVSCAEPAGEPPSPPTAPCLINAPIQAEGRTIGVVSMAHPEPGVLNEWHLRLLPLFGNFLGRILTTNRLLNRLEEEVGKRTRQLESLLAETHQMKLHYQNLSLVDELTGLYNRRFFFSESKRALGQALRYRSPLSFLLMDLDHFKQINDTYGHAMGDTVLQGVARALESQLRESDILARVGGEEFAAVLPETGPSGAEELAERLLSTVRELSWSSGGEKVAITASIGITAMLPDDKVGTPESLDSEDVLDMLLSQADRAMYRAKNQGGDRAVETAG